MLGGNTDSAEDTPAKDFEIRFVRWSITTAQGGPPAPQPDIQLSYSLDIGGGKREQGLEGRCLVHT